MVTVCPRYYLPEAAHPWKVFTEAGCQVDLVSVRGGQAPMDGADTSDPVQRAFLDDAHIAAQLAATPRPSDVDAAGYDAILYVGGHGTMCDFPDDQALSALARDIYEAGGAVAVNSDRAVNLDRPLRFSREFFRAGCEGLTCAAARRSRPVRRSPPEA